MTTAGFVPNKISAFVAIGNAEVQKSFNNMRINGVYRSAWYGVYIATPAWKKFMDDYLKAANVPIDNEYGKPDSKYMAGGKMPSLTPQMRQEDYAEQQRKRDEDARRQAAQDQAQAQANQGAASIDPATGGSSVTGDGRTSTSSGSTYGNTDGTGDASSDDN